MPKRSSAKPDSVWETWRTIKSSAISHPADEIAINNALSEAAGIVKSELNISKKKLRVLYNITVINYSELTTRLEEIGFPPDDNWWQRVKANWYSFLDENAKTNARTPTPPCCNKPPK